MKRASARRKAAAKKASAQPTAVAKNAPRASYIKANRAAIEAMISGRGPDDTAPNPDRGAAMVVNIAAVHVPAFCRLSRALDAKPYKNAYDLGKHGLGNLNRKPTNREIVDAALPLDRVSPRDIYFGALELNGTGIRFYGDVCLVLKDDAVAPETVLMDRNSYDLIRSPIREVVDKAMEAKRPEVRRREAKKLSGVWDKNLGSMAADKVLEFPTPRSRRLTAGQVSEALRSDEDYIEVLKKGSFGCSNLREARLSTSEAAFDAMVAERLANRPTPSLAALMSRYRRRNAERALRAAKVAVRVVTTSGRIRD